MSQRATGRFEVKLTPQVDDGDAAAPGRMLLDKVFHGDLEATSRGQMLAFRSRVKGSAGYVAMERVDGVLLGRRGSFVLQHSGTMTRGAPALQVGVVPDSGSGELVGLEGRMEIVIAPDGTHSYVFDFRYDDPA